MGINPIDIPEDADVVLGAEIAFSGGATGAVPREGVDGVSNVVGGDSAVVIPGPSGVFEMSGEGVPDGSGEVEGELSPVLVPAGAGESVLFWALVRLYSEGGHSAVGSSTKITTSLPTQAVAVSGSHSGPL
jgi:hypothetical protein